MPAATLPDLAPTDALERLRLLLTEKTDGVPPSRLDRATLARLIERVEAAPLFGHAYTFYCHLRDEAMAPEDLLDFAASHGLAGVKLHVADGGRRALAARRPGQQRSFGARARARGLRLHLEISTTERAALAEVVGIAAETGAESIRCYPRYAGRVSQILPRVVDDLGCLLHELDPAGRFRVVVEQHEDLTSPEMRRIVEAVGDPRVALLFDFANMLNAGERPLEALAVQAPLVTEAHLKDARRLPDRGGWAQLGCRTGTGDIPVARLLFELLLLGDSRPQVTAIALEEEVDMFAPAYRFPDEAPDPVIPARSPSTTQPAGGMPPDIQRANELRHAEEQVATVRGLLAELRALAAAALAEPAPRR